MGMTLDLPEASVRVEGFRPLPPDWTSCARGLSFIVCVYWMCYKQQEIVILDENWKTWCKEGSLYKVTVFVLEDFALFMNLCFI